MPIFIREVEEGWKKRDERRESNEETRKNKERPRRYKMSNTHKNYKIERISQNGPILTRDVRHLSEKDLSKLWESPALIRLDWSIPAHQNLAPNENCPKNARFIKTEYQAIVKGEAKRIKKRKQIRMPEYTCEGHLHRIWQTFVERYPHDRKGAFGMHKNPPSPLPFASTIQTWIREKSPPESAGLSFISHAHADHCPVDWMEPYIKARKTESPNSAENYKMEHPEALHPLIKGEVRDKRNKKI
ncbi:MAG TPA: hypothetical protein VKO42_05145, partial [Patescibacteria group bacterium]|nr:hypothetical protein [Patescibacteria group bacterium]